MRFAFFVLIALLAIVPAGADESITATNFVFTSNDITIVAGESVTWNWTTGHTSTSTTGDNCTQSAGPDAWDFQFPGQSKIFDNAGNFNFMCTPHCASNNMKGIVRVVDFNFSCTPTTVSSQQNGSGDTTCTVTSLNGLTLPVTLSESGLPAGVTIGYSTNPVNPTDSSTVTFNVDNTVAEGSYQVTLTATATSASSTPGVRTKDVVITLNVTGPPLFLDTFDDTDNSGWTFGSGSWSSPSGALVGSTPKKSTAFPSYNMCSDCRVEADMSASGGEDAQLSLFGWYVNNQNYVELLMKMEAGRWILKHKVNGLLVKKAKAVRAIDPNVNYHAAISYNGAGFDVWIDGEQVITNATSSVPASGMPGVRVKKTTGTFDSIAVYQ